MFPSQATAVEAASETEDEPVERAMQTPDSVPKAVAVVSSTWKSSAFFVSVTPRLVKKQAGTNFSTPSASNSVMTVDRLIGSRVLHSATGAEAEAEATIDATVSSVNASDVNRILGL